MNGGKGDIETSVGDALGDPENPLTESAVVAKACVLMAAAGANGREANAMSVLPSR